MFTEKPQVEVLSRNKERLLSLEKSGKFVFHGSPSLLPDLQPRQSVINDKKIGNPAVYATTFAEIAIFRSLINNQGIEDNSVSTFDFDKRGLSFGASRNLLDRARGKKGLVYVLDRQKFTNFSNIECQSFENNKPVEVIEVDFQDLPNDIEILDPENFKTTDIP